MHRSIGDMLDNPVEYFSWMHDDACRFGAVYAVTRLGLLKHLGDKPVTAEAVAKDAHLDAGMVKRLLGYMAAEGVLAVDAEGRFSSTARSTYLESIDFITEGGAWSRQASLHLAEAVEQGKTAYELNFGLPVFEHFKANPDRAMTFGRAMSYTTGLSEDHLFANHSFQPFQLAVDVGGSHGSVLLRLLQENPDSRGILFDLPETIAQAADTVAAAPAASRTELASGSFFDAVPAGGDLYILKQILHDWSDSQCKTILDAVRAAIVPGGRLAVMERVIPDEHRPHMAWDFDMVMMVWTTGRERNLSEYKAMFEASGFAFDNFTENPDGMGVVEAIAV